MNRDDRQELCIKKWKEAKGRGIMLLATGFGKTYTALKICDRLVKQQSKTKILVIVPSDNLRKQWLKNVVQFGLHFNITIDTVHSLVLKPDERYDFIIADEIHMYASPVFYQVFTKMTSKYFLGLTGTIDRLDGKESLLFEIAPVIDRITLKEAIENKWVSEYVQYKLEIDVDLTEYHEFSRVFNNHFAYFGHNFQLAMGCLSHKHVRYAYAKKIGASEKEVMIKAVGFSRGMRGRKDFIYNHPKKIELVNTILEHRQDYKAVTFTKTVKHASTIEYGTVFHGSIKPKSKADKIIKDFMDAEKGVLNTVKAIDMGSDFPYLNLGIIISGDSSSITKDQRIGRVLRYSEGKVAELWHLVLTDTAEENWFKSSNKDKPFTVVKEDQLVSLLKGGDWQSIEDEEEFMYVL